jgi:hypothetical protein
MNEDVFVDYKALRLSKVDTSIEYQQLGKYVLKEVNGC